MLKLQFDPRKWEGGKVQGCCSVRDMGSCVGLDFVISLDIFQVKNVIGRLFCGRKILVNSCQNLNQGDLCWLYTGQLDFLGLLLINLVDFLGV